MKIILILGLIFFVFACNSANNKEILSANMMDSIAQKSVSSDAAVENLKDSTRKFVRTAELKFKVKNVIQSTYDIENIVKLQEGFVTLSNLKSEIENVIITPISQDSSLETTSCQVTGFMTVRVPNTKLDTTLKEIARNIDFLDYRIIKAEDIALQILSNKLLQNRSEKNAERLAIAIDKKGKRLNETANVEETKSSKEEQSDNAKINNLALNDQINFSTISLALYQRPSIKREMIANDKNIKAYEPGFGTKIMDSLHFGWVVLEEIVLFFTRFWAVFLFFVLGYFAYKKYWKKFKK